MASVVYLVVGWDGAVDEFPDHDVRSYIASASAAAAYVVVSVAAFCSCLWPAFVGPAFVDLGPEPFCYRLDRFLFAWSVGYGYLAVVGVTYAFKKGEGCHLTAE